MPTQQAYLLLRSRTRRGAHHVGSVTSAVKSTLVTVACVFPLVHYQDDLIRDGLVGYAKAANSSD